MVVLRDFFAIVSCAGLLALVGALEKVLGVEILSPKHALSLFCDGSDNGYSPNPMASLEADILSGNAIPLIPFNNTP